EDPLEAGQAGPVGHHVLEEAQLSARADDPVELAESGRLLGHRASTREATPAAKVASSAGSPSAVPSTTMTGTAAPVAASWARSRRYVSGSTATTSLTDGG